MHPFFVCYKQENRKEKTMNLASYRVPLDIHTTISQAVIPFKQYDSGRRLEFCLREDGRNYEIDENVFAVLRAKKADGTVLYNTCATIDNMFVYDLTNQTTSALGIVECELTVYSKDKRQITSPRFIFVIEDNIYDDKIIESKDEFTALAEAITATNNLNAHVEQTPDGVLITIIQKDGTENTAEVLNPSRKEVEEIVDEWFTEHSDEVNAVLYDPQNKTPHDKWQARQNIDALSPNELFSRSTNGAVPKAPTTEGHTKYLREDGTWAEPEGKTKLEDLNDTDISTPAHNETLVYDAVEGKWKNVPNSVVKYTEQTLTESQKIQARANIDAPSKVLDAGSGNIAVLQEDGSYMDSGVALSDMGGGTNLNLLDNGHFVVNQRGQSIYTGTGYTVDRWKLEGEGSLHVLDNGSVSIESSASDSTVNLLQRFNHSYFKEGVYTLSIKCSGQIFSTQLNYSGDRFDYVRLEFEDSAHTKGVIRITHGDYHHNVTISPLNNMEIISNIEAVKLEVGGTSTLANDFPIYCDELLRCLSSTEVNGDKYSNQALSKNGVGLAVPSFKSIYAGTDEMEDGVTPLDTGVIYLQYEE